MKKILVVSKSNFFKKNIKNKNFFFIQNKKYLNLTYLNKLRPDIIFVPHWSWKINKEIINKYLCIGFHATPLPYGRGGSPVQNMILKGFLKTKLCALKLDKKLDSGPIYKQVNVSLKGSGSEIFTRIYKKILILIKDLSLRLPIPKKQYGKITFFKRRTPQQSNIKKTFNLNELYNFIRMLDISENKFPKAFLKIGNLKFEFFNSTIIKNCLKAEVSIKKFK